MSQRKKFELHVDEQIKKWTDLIDGLELKIKKDREDIDANRKSQMRGKINDLKTVRQTLQQKHSALRKADDKDWPDIKAHIDNLLGDIDEEFRAGLAYFH